MINYINYDFLKSKVKTFLTNEVLEHSYLNIKAFINEMCLFFGSSLEGRKASFAYHMKIKKHIPIFVNSSICLLEIIPNLWVNYFAIKKVKTSKEKGCHLIFQDGTSLICDHSSFLEQRLMMIFNFCRIMNKN